MYQVDEKGFFGKFGGAYVPEILYKCVTELQQSYKPIIESEEFKKEYRALLKDYVGRPSPLYFSKCKYNSKGKSFQISGNIQSFCPYRAPC